jgi:hypothetical protein
VNPYRRVIEIIFPAKLVSVGPVAIFLENPMRRSAEGSLLTPLDNKL